MFMRAINFVMTGPETRLGLQTGSVAFPNSKHGEHGGAGYTGRLISETQSRTVFYTAVYVLDGLMLRRLDYLFDWFSTINKYNVIQIYV